MQVSFTDDADNEETLTSEATDAVSAAPAPNTPATGAPTINGTAQVGEALTADTSGIADADGLGNVQYEYQWLADDSDISPERPTPTYTLADTDEGKAIKVEVSFTDDAGNDESMTSSATDAVAAPPPNSPATGAPSISGTAQVDETLTADTSDIADADGLDERNFQLPVAGRRHGNRGRYQLDLHPGRRRRGQGHQGRVTFTDDEGNDETLTSAATDAVAGPAQQLLPPERQPSVARCRWAEALTADTSGHRRRGRA